jgi:hypothetical protein
MSNQYKLKVLKIHKKSYSTAILVILVKAIYRLGITVTVSTQQKQ